MEDKNNNIIENYTQIMMGGIGKMYRPRVSVDIVLHHSLHDLTNAIIHSY